MSWGLQNNFICADLEIWSWQGLKDSDAVCRIHKIRPQQCPKNQSNEVKKAKKLLRETPELELILCRFFSMKTYFTLNWFDSELMRTNDQCSFKHVIDNDYTPPLHKVLQVNDCNGSLHHPLPLHISHLLTQLFNLACIKMSWIKYSDSINSVLHKLKQHTTYEFVRHTLCVLLKVTE